jgi:hypothetical protein
MACRVSITAEHAVPRIDQGVTWEQGSIHKNCSSRLLSNTLGMMIEVMHNLLDNHLSYSLLYPKDHTISCGVDGLRRLYKIEVPTSPIR